MTKDQAEHIIIKFLANEANIDDLKALSTWLNTPQNEYYFNHYIKTNYTIDYAISSYNKEDLKTRLLQQIKTDNNIFLKRRIRSVLKYAAIALVFVSVGYFSQKQNFSNNDLETLTPKEESVVLELENGKLQPLDITKTKSIKNTKGEIVGNQEKNQLNYLTSKKEKIQTLIYNTIKVPYGKKFEVYLSDSTKVYLNAGTSLRYPVQFINGLNREVFLNGEAYFDVAKDKTHPFIVTANDVKIQAIGTQFNVSAYQEDTNITTVLAEGKVAVFNNGDILTNQSTTLLPTQGAFFSKKNKSFITQTVDVNYHIAWIYGKIIFKDTPFKDIRRRLERKYNIRILNTNSELDKQIYQAKFDVESIEQILQTLNESFPIEYKIENNQIIIH